MMMTTVDHRDADDADADDDDDDDDDDGDDDDVFFFRDTLNDTHLLLGRDLPPHLVAVAVDQL